MSTGHPSSAVTSEALERISRRAALNEPTLALAEQRWRTIQQAILSGVTRSGLDQLGEAREIRARYVSIRRLSDEARRITLLESEPEEMRTVYAIDPHLIGGYCQYWRQDFRNFDFTRLEWEPHQKKEREEFIVFLLSAILSMRELICLDAGRQEIADILAFFLEERSEHTNAAQHLKTFDDALNTILDQTGITEPRGRKQISKAIWERFEALIGAGGIPYMKQSLSTARLSSVLRSGRLRSSFAAIRSKMSVEGDEALAAVHHAQALFEAFRRNDERFREARSSLYHAYVSFASATNLGAHFEASKDLAMLRAGETSNINALFEMHLLNVCLSEAGAKIRVHYITDSPLLYEFVNGFPRNSFSVDLVHPRHVFVFENKPTAENLARYQQVLVGPNAFIHAVPKDGSIKLSELNRFEEAFVGVLRDVRATYSFARVDSQEGRTHLAQVIVDFARRFGNDETKAKLTMVADILESLSDKLEATSDKVDRLLGESADERSSIGFEAYRKFVEEMPLRGRANTLLVRTFGNGARGSPRAVCIPVSGGYRNLFKVYDPDVVKIVRDESGDAVLRKPTTDLLSLLQSPAIDKSDPSYGSALRDFGRAIYAMADREWLLSISFTQATLRQLKFEPASGTGQMLSRVASRTPEARRRFLMQEALLVQHFARRGVAANLETLLRRQKRLLMAAEDLFQCAIVTLSIDDHDSYDTAFEPNSLRHALAGIALALEWLVVREMRRATGRPIGHYGGGGRILPRAGDSKVAWYGLEIEDNTLEYYWNEHLSADSLGRDLDLLNARIEGIVQTIQGGKGGEHSAEFWRYIQIRALSLHALLSLLKSLKIVQTSGFISTETVVARLRELLRAHTTFSKGENNTVVETVSRLHPFTNFLTDALQFIEDEGAPSEDIASNIKRSQALLAISEDHFRLSENGFPRLVSQTFLSCYGPEAAERLKRLADTLQRESTLGNTPFRPVQTD